MKPSNPYVSLYYRFNLSFRNIGLMIFEQGIAATYKSIRNGYLKFRRRYTKALHQERAREDWYYLDKVFCRIVKALVYFWRAKDQDRQILNTLAQQKYSTGNYRALIHHSLNL